MKRRAIKVKKKPATSIELSQPRRVWFAAGDALQRDGREHLRCQRLFAGVTIDLGRLGWRCKTGRHWRVARAAAEPTSKRTAKDDEHCAPQHAPAPPRFPRRWPQPVGPGETLPARTGLASAKSVHNPLAPKVPRRKCRKTRAGRSVRPDHPQNWGAPALTGLCAPPHYTLNLT